MYLDTLTIAGTLIAITFIGILLAIRSHWYCDTRNEDAEGDCQYAKAARVDRNNSECLEDAGNRRHGLAEGSGIS